MANLTKSNSFPNKEKEMYKSVCLYPKAVFLKLGNFKLDGPLLPEFPSQYG